MIIFGNKYYPGYIERWIINARNYNAYKAQTKIKHSKSYQTCHMSVLITDSTLTVRKYRYW